MVLLPIGAACFVAAKRNPGWGLFGIGALTFVISQVGHIPFNWLLLQRYKLIPSDTSNSFNLIILAIFLGLSAGIFEEISRYITYRYWAKDARTWGKGLMLGIGHGGIEAIILGILVGINYLVMARMRSGALLNLVPNEQWPMVEAQIEAVFSAPWYLILLGALERLFALCFHMAASLMVMQVFIHRRVRWLFAAIFWHTLLNSLAVVLSVIWNVYYTEVIIGIMALFSVVIIFLLRTPEPVEFEMESLPETGPVKPVDLEITAEILENSRFN